MLNVIRYKIANYYARRALAEIEKGDFESIMKGLDYFEKSIAIAPLSEELVQLRNEMMSIIENQI